MTQYLHDAVKEILGGQSVLEAIAKLLKRGPRHGLGYGGGSKVKPVAGKILRGAARFAMGKPEGRRKMTAAFKKGAGV